MAEHSPFPPQSRSYILSFQFSSWYPKFSNISIESTIIPLSKEFHDYLDADSIFVPEGSEDFSPETSLSDDEGGEDSDSETPSSQRFSFPELDEQIRACVKHYTAVFPKLNFSSPKVCSLILTCPVTLSCLQDAAWVLASGSPLKCTCPADVYMLLKSSDFINHDLSLDSVFDQCAPEDDPVKYNLHLVLRKWYSIDCSRELRCFVRKNRLIGISQRDMNYYEFLNDPDTKAKILAAVSYFWQTKIKPQWDANEDYIFDILLTRDLSRAHIVDFNPYASKTDSLLFTYDELLEILNKEPTTPKFRIIDSKAHAATNSNAPAYQHNMVPFEALSLSNGRNIEEFAEKFKEGLLNTMQDDEGSRSL